MNFEKKILINTLYQIIGKILISIFTFISTIYLTRYLGVHLFGEYSLIFSFLGLIVIFADFGLGTLMTRDFSYHKENKNYISSIFTLRLFFSIFVLILANIVVLFLPYKEEVKLGILVASFGSLSILLASILWAIFQAELRFDKIVNIQLIVAILGLLLTVAGVYLRLSFIYFVLFYVLSSIIGLLLSLKMCLYSKGLFLFRKKKLLLEVISQSWPLGVGAIMTVAYFKIDTLILSLYYNPSTTPDLGFYAASYKIFEVSTLFGGFFTQTIFPVFSTVFNTKYFIIEYKKYFYYSLAIAIFSSLGIYLFSENLIVLLGGQQFLPSVNALKILSLSIGTTTLAGFFLIIALVGKKQTLLLKFAFIALVINVVLNIIIIPKFSYIGASWTTFITQFFILITNMIIAIRIVKQRKNC